MQVFKFILAFIVSFVVIGFIGYWGLQLEFAMKPYTEFGQHVRTLGAGVGVFVASGFLAFIFAFKKK